MLNRAAGRVSAATAGAVRIIQGDIRVIDIGAERYDIVVAAAVLHHLREDAEWTDVLERVYRSLRPGGSFWVSDLIVHGSPAVQSVMWRRYGEYLAALQDEAYRDRVFAYIEQEDTPRSLNFQLDLMRTAGFQGIEVLHKNGVFAAYGGVKG
jgi:tRNA (cmo5U34)-methyltransferase